VENYYGQASIDCWSNEAAAKTRRVGYKPPTPAKTTW